MNVVRWREIMLGQRLRWLGGCCLPLLLGCGAPPAEPKSAPVIASAARVTASAAPAAKRAPPLSLTVDPAPLAYPDVSLSRASALPPKVTLKGQTYGLPVAARSLVNLERDVVAQGLLDRGSPELATLLEHGSVVVTAPSWAAGRNVNWRFDTVYGKLRERRVPILVSADAVLHHQHVFFNEILKAVELRTLAPMLTSLVAGVYQELLPRLDAEALPEPLLNELAVLAVARKQLEPEFVPHPALAERVEHDLGLIVAHQAADFSATQSDAECLASSGARGRCYIEDFSQYVVRGHYTVHPALSRYFLASMWLGRMGRRLKYDDELAQQVLLIEAVKRAQCQYAGARVPAVQLLSRMDQLLQYFIGKSDDLTLPEVDAVVRAQLGERGEVELRGEALENLRRELQRLRAPRILSGAVTDYGEDAAATTQGETQGLRLLGQRFAPDSEILGRLVHEHVGPNPEHERYAEVAKDALHNRGDYCDTLPLELRSSLSRLKRDELTAPASRCICERSLELWRRENFPVTRETNDGELTQVCRLMPSSLDVASVMGSALASRYLAPSRKYTGYERELAALRADHAAAAQAGPQNLYEEWLSALTPLLSPMPRGYPTWMTGTPYQKKSLRTFAASWTELRQDTILYVKQSYTGGRMIVTSGATQVQAPPEAYGIVEPRPELYERIKTFMTQLQLTLKTLDALPVEVSSSIDGMNGLLDRLIDISLRQLQGQKLGATDQDLIKRIGQHLFGIVHPLLTATTPPGPPSSASASEGLRLTNETQGFDEALSVPLVADVHTDLHTQRVLEEGTGPLEWMLAVTRMPDGTLAVSAGPVFSYKELLHPLDDRLTNEKWRGAMDAGRDVPAPLWWTADRPLANGFELPPFATPPR